MRIQPLMTQAREATLRWPGLWLPALMINAFQGLALSPLAVPALQWVVGVCANVGSFIIVAGWLAMTNRALEGEPPRFNDFMAGVNRRWAPLVAGNLAFYLLLGGALALLALWGERHYRFEVLQHWLEMVNGLSRDQLPKVLDPAALPAPIRGWMKLFALWVAFAGVVSFALLFWQPIAVLRDRPWWRAWADSAHLAATKLPQVALLVGLQLGALFLASTFSGSGNPLLVLGGLGLALFVSIYFTVLYAAVAREAYPAAPLPGATIDVGA